jgi:hypothetical protein
VVAAGCLCSLIVVRAPGYADLLGDEHVVEAVFEWILPANVDVGYCQRSLRASLLDFFVFEPVRSEIVEKGTTQYIDVLPVVLL